jgi:hypothetical protein
MIMVVVLVVGMEIATIIAKWLQAQVLKMFLMLSITLKENLKILEPSRTRKLVNRSINLRLPLLRNSLVERVFRIKGYNSINNSFSSNNN